MANVETINSASHLNTIISNNQLVIIDFKATWCGPCKVIAPFYDSLADKYGSTAGVAFVKVDVDANPEVAQRYGVRSMPTFLFLKKGVEVDRVTGANRGSLTSATERLVAQAGGASGGAFGKGYKLGGGDGGSAAPGAVAGGGARYVHGGRIVDYLPIGARARRWLTAIIVFVGLYLTSLFSLDAIPAAENSMFANYGKPREPKKKTDGGPSGGGGGGFGGGGPRGPPGGGPGGRRVGTIDSIRGDGCSSGTCG